MILSISLEGPTGGCSVVRTKAGRALGQVGFQGAGPQVLYRLTRIWLYDLILPD